MVCAPRVLAYYVNNLDPIALPIYRGLALRWYGLAYLFGFIVGFLLLRRLARRGMWVLKPEQTADFIAASAMFGVFAGGRLGYILLYLNGGFINGEWFTKLFAGQSLAGLSVINGDWIAKLTSDPLVIFRVWEGGMASHGGILGLAIFTWFYAKKHKVSWAGLSDGLCVVGPLGLFFGRMANFINGELYGRVTYGVGWAVKFPLSFLDNNAPEAMSFDAAAAAAAHAEPSLAPLYQALITATDDNYAAARSRMFEAMLDANRHSGKVTQAIEPFLQPRHPSQIYEGLLEGLLLFAILWGVRVKFPKAPAGLITGLFFALYAIFRICGEQFREPDAAMVGILTKGQFFSFFMFIFAAAFFGHAWREWKRGRG